MWFVTAIAFIIGTIIFVIGTRNFKIKEYAFNDFILKVKSIKQTIHIKNIVFGFARYLIFTHQYYFLLIAFDVHISYLSLIATIYLVYLLASIVPSFQFLDFALKSKHDHQS